MMDGPIPLGVASGMTVNAVAEWASLLPLADGTHQCVRGLTMRRVTADMPRLNLVPVLDKIKAQCKGNRKIQNLKVPEVVGGEVQMIIGIQYQNLFPTPIHTLPNGLTVFESRLKPTAPGVLACIGGPVEALEHLCGAAGVKSTMSYMSCLIQNLKNFKPRVDFFPANIKQHNMLMDGDLPGVEEFVMMEKAEDEDVYGDETSDEEYIANFKKLTNQVKVSTVDLQHKVAKKKKRKSKSKKLKPTATAGTVDNELVAEVCDEKAEIKICEEVDEEKNEDIELIFEHEISSPHGNIVTLEASEDETENNTSASVGLFKNLSRLPSGVYRQEGSNTSEVKRTEDSAGLFKNLSRLPLGGFRQEGSSGSAVGKFDEDKCKKCKECTVCKPKLKKETNLVQSELEKFMKHQDAGLEIAFKCPKCRSCRDCLRGAGKEKLSMKQEAEQLLIKNSVRIDQELNRAIAFLAFTADPKGNLTPNTHIAIKRLQNVCRKYGGNPKVKEMIMKGFQKLVDRKHIIPWSELTPEQKSRIEKNGAEYTIPWDVGFKEGSLSTPARPTFDASSKTPGGISLNDILAKGDADLVDLVDMVLEWLIGPDAVTGDISQFYNNVLLEEEHWPYQQVVWYPDMDPSNPLERGVIRTCIYGVCCVGAQTEEVMRLLADAVEPYFPDVSTFLRRSRYVDDFGKSNRNKEESKTLIKNTDSALADIDMRVKGWVLSGEDPPADLSDDGVSVGFAGMEWLTKIDAFKLPIQSLHFAKKKRGRFPEDLVKLDGTFGKTIDEYTPINLSRRMCTSVAARIFDVPGKLSPLALRLKHDLRKLIKADPDWDHPISVSLRERWIQNFKIIEELRDVLYVRCPIPSDALRTSVRLWLLCDGADGGMIIAAYSGNERPDGSWSCSHLFSKGLLAPAGWSTPQLELHALHSMANMAAILMSALGTWVELVLAGSDSEIALSWTIYEKVKLQVFHRMRVSNIRNKLDLEKLFHVDGKSNVADIGTRPDYVTAEILKPGSDWLNGIEWMTQPVEKAKESGIIKSTKDIKLDNDSRKVFKEGVIFEEFENVMEVKTDVINAVDNKKIVEREMFSNYLFPPLKRSFRPFIRITAFVLVAYRRFKKGMVIAKIKRGESVSDGSKLPDLNFSPVKFIAFPMIVGKNVEERLDVTDQNVTKLTQLFRIDGVDVNNDSKRSISLTDEELSASLEHIYKKATKEIFKYHDKKTIDKMGQLKDGILYCKTRLLEGQTLRAVGGLEDTVDLQSLTGVNFNVPLIDRHSPLAVSIALHLHYAVVKHKGAETIYRMSLQYARILQGRILLKEVTDDCLFCKKIRGKYLRQIMGPLSEYQLSISPIFYYTYIDAWGPVKAYVPGYEKETRSGTKIVQLNMMVFGCAATGMINCQMVEGGKDTGCVLDAFNRFFAETCVPKICFPDKDPALLKALAEGEVNLIGSDGVLARVRGIYFQTCPSQGHNAHGRIEARIKMIQECLERSGLKGAKLHALGWQTVAKTIERDINSIPLGFLQHQGDSGPLLRVLTPNSLRLSTSSQRAPVGLFSVPDRPEDLMTKIEDAYQLWYRVWNVDYVPLIAQRQKWHFEQDNLKENDIVYFKLKDSAISSEWHIGKVEFVVPSKDENVREIGISYKYDTEEGVRKFSVVTRPIREVVRIMNIDDTTLLDDIRSVQKEAKRIFDTKKIVSGEELLNFDTKPEESEKEDVEIVDAKEEEEIVDGDLVKKPVENEEEEIVVDENSDRNKEIKPETKKGKSKSKTEVEKLQIPGWKGPASTKRKVQRKSYHDDAFFVHSVRDDPIPKELLLTVHNIGYEANAVGEDTGERDRAVELDEKTGVDGVADWDEMFFGLGADKDVDAIKPVILL